MQIEFTHDYDSFQLLKENRAISNAHVNSLIRDETFPQTFKYHPIIVDEKKNIIDGQHRFFAARHLNIPIFFIVQPGANLETIKKYNAQQRQWLEKDYLIFYLKQRKADYVFIDSLIRAFKFTLGSVLDVISFFDKVSRKQNFKLFRMGEMRISEKKEISSFFSELDNGFQNLRAYHDIIDYRHLYTRAYIRAYCELYLSDIKKFIKLMKNLYLVFNSLPLTTRYEEAYQFLCKAASKKISR